MDLTEQQSQGPGILLIFSPCFLLYKKQFSPDFVSQNFALTFCLFITYICSYSLNLVISELYVVDSFLFLIVKERLIFIISYSLFLLLLAYTYILLYTSSWYFFFLCMRYDYESIIRTYLVSCILWLFPSSYSATGRTSDGDWGACSGAQSSVICQSQSETQRTTRNQHVYRELTSIN